MKIARIDLWHVAIPTRATFWPSWIPGFPQTENRFTLLRLRTASGLEDWAADAAIAREREGIGSLLGPYLLGERADDISSVRQRIREMGYLGVRAGWIEPACWDVVGKARNKPVWELLGGAPGAVRLYASTGEVRPAAQRAREVEQRLAEGFSAVKLRVHAATLEEDLALIEEVRRAAGDKAVLGVDANQGWRVAVVADAPRWDYRRALSFCRRAEELGYAW
ncbi:MAG: mandelate racemase/muconate lactonizing enzyme family protein, partial [Deltaproteobacteria bacterium]